MKNLKSQFLLFLTIISSSFFSAQLPTNGLDVKHYAFNIALNDSTNVIKGKAIITTAFTENENNIVFDFVNKNADGKGMTVFSVTKNNENLKFSKDAQHLIINDKGILGQENTYTINYEGIPADGLIIGNTKNGDRSFFADNWPNRAHNWITCNDHLSDKATSEFLVTAPDHYQVVSNGREIEETNLSENLKLTHWKSEVELSTKIMAIGVTKFAVNNLGNVEGIPVSEWVFPEDRDNGFKSYNYSKEILKYFVKNIGAFPFEKLANVQSKTIFGGLENAGCIFYSENSINSKGVESLMAHETAHQWFGDNVTEKDWPHLWLSEGFATYMTNLYLEYKYGKDSLNNLMKQQRIQVISFSKKVKKPVVDSSEADNLMNLLNANSYQKGGWVLHILRRKIGDDLFWKSVRTYYETYKGKNATTEDFEKVVEEVSHQDLKTFFKQWLFTSGQPLLKIDWKYDQLTKKVGINIEQKQIDFFEFPLSIAFKNGTEMVLKTFNIKNKLSKEDFSVSFEPKEIMIDPNVDLLFEMDVIN
ncbi:M1 family metallopeptidase [Halpernia frigidisoli]|uniref:Aminopeptidase N n=1 Tax=Halpernia frigidisoli TaxID=1125876 RepID=A0A1I3EFH4_9FLAO|nr:M1 family metallopeptidase [Halpernia frigidisoli]SFH97699.1 Peptidase family M1 [Halpernia frigidisoli]